MILLRRFYCSLVLLGGVALAGCAAKPPAPVVRAPATVVQAPDPAVIHRVWEAGYLAGYDEAERLETRRYEQEQDEMSNVPAAASAPAPVAAPSQAASPVAAAPNLGGFQSIGPATPVTAGD